MRDPSTPVGGAAPLVVLSGGGTGGHLYPALAIADALRSMRPDVEVLFVGARRGLESRVLPERGERHVLLSVRGIDRSRPLASWRAATGLVLGLIRVGRIFLERRPAAVVVTGGYAGAAAGIVAGLMGIPLILQEQNSAPGAVTRLLTRFAVRVHLAFPEAVDQLGVDEERCAISGNPVRPPSAMGRTEARAVFDIPADVFLVFVTGGSQGSRALNVGVLDWIDGVATHTLPRPDTLHLLWSTGPEHWRAVEEALERTKHPRWIHALPYIEEMPAALAAADVALSRAGAMTTAEQVNQGLPALLVPLPTAAADHQMKNARSLERAGAARVIPEDELSAERLSRELDRLVSDPGELRRMGERALERARPAATETIAADVARFLPVERRAA